MAQSSSEAPEVLPPGASFPLTPIQRWFFAQPLMDHEHFNQAVLLAPRQPLTPTFLQRALAVLMDQHAALRLRFEVVGSARPSQSYGPLEDELPLHFEDLRALPADQQIPALGERATRWQRSLNLATGPLLRMVLFELSIGQRLLWCVHHLAVDAVSWRILLGDLEFLFDLAKDERPLVLPPATAPFSAWASHLQQLAFERPPDVTYWSAMPVCDLPVDRAGNPTRNSTRHIERRVERGVTQALLEGEAHRAYNTKIDEFLLTALAMTLAAWTGQRQCVIDIEGHGRTSGTEGLDLSRTVGWFTTVHPVRLVLPDSDEPGALLRAVKEQVRGVPNAGLGYSILRYGEGSPLHGRPDAPVAFNYLGQIEQALGGELLDFATEGVGDSHTKRGRRSRLLDVDAYSSGGTLSVTWSYSANQFDTATIERLADRFVQALEALVTHCRSPNAVGYTPSDFALMTLPQSALDALARRYDRAVKAVYPLTPMQQGLLFHSLEDRTAYVELLHCRIDGEFDAACFRAAWESLIRRHDVLRTAFNPETEPPSQIVLRSAMLPWREHDWRRRDPASQERDLQHLVASDRQRGFELASAPLMRCHFVRLSDTSVRFVWCFHHLLLDGWSLPIVLGELMQLYREPAARLPAALPFESYVAWLIRQDQETALAHWRAVLAGFEMPTPLPGARVASSRDTPEVHAEYRLELNAAESASVLEFARTHRLTLATVLQGVWASILHRWSGESDVVFGITVSGRDIDLPGVDSMIGLLINTIPARVRIEPCELVPWLLS
ncbi:MAG: non-ribosomal peptide synthetase, partial [Gammaproteobacteria bacterium]|nr:non-ribosomal peptide synthetase [Gammaproteobacteria bacterium]